jgi:hypothetical protein
MPEKRARQRARIRARAAKSPEGRLSERGHGTSQAVAKRRARSLKRETGGATRTRGRHI